MADEQKPQGAKENKEEKVETIQVELLARSYMQPVPGTDPVKYRKYVKGSVLNVTPEELECGNHFKPSFREVSL